VFAAKKLTGFFLKRLGLQFVERTTRVNAKSETSRLAALARNGTALVFFPEGGLSRSPGLRWFRQGAFVVATDLSCPVVPIAIRGTRAMVPPGSRLMRHGRLHLVVGAPVYPAGSDWHAAVDLVHRVREAIAPYCGQPNLA
jgi:1-acyl-sn-glycerol-3-phosphate acyltransferase